LEYELGVQIGSVTIAVAPEPAPGPVDPPKKTRVKASFGSKDDAGFSLVFPAFDAATAQAPDENRLYLLPEGSDQPSTAQGWVDSPYVYSLIADPVAPEGAPAYVVPYPVAPAGNYVAQVIHGYN
jgi:hypothetical protein